VTLRVKVCGVVRREDALLAADLGFDALGFNFVPGSPRRLDEEGARDIASVLPPFVVRVGVFADERPETVEAIARRVGLHCVQLHGNEAPGDCARLAIPWYKAHRVTPDFRPEEIGRYASAAFLLDSHVPGLGGGTGRTFDWEVARRAARYGRVILAGGLRPDNVEEAVRIARPYAVDVSSGVESAPGEKDGALLEEFLRSARSAAAKVTGR
jgi:phosphoribosylanthranilate isomerase